MGCGAAVSALALQSRYPRAALYGLDHKPEILKNAPLAIRPVQADLRTLPFKWRSLGLILVRHPDLIRWPDGWRRAFEAVPVLLASGGILLATCYSLPELERIRALMPAVSTPLPIRRDLLSPPGSDGV